METIKVECNACNGTGLYIGFAESKGIAVVCTQCNGTGCAQITFTPFTRRKGRRDISIVCRSRGSFIGTGIGPAGTSITYQEFEQGRMPS